MEDVEFLEQMLGPMRVSDAGIELANGQIWDVAALRRGAKVMLWIADQIDTSRRASYEAAARFPAFMALLLGCEVPDARR